MLEENIPQTERVNPQSAGFDQLSVEEIVVLLVEDQRTAVEAVLEQRSVIARVVDETVGRLERGGRLHYVGAGTSGRLGVLDASEMSSTFGTLPELVCAHIAGGESALTRAIEGAEDDDHAGEEAVQHVTPSDVVIGISASGGARYVVRAIETAREVGAYTVAICNSEGTALARAAQVSIVLRTGPELLAGSTRLKAGTSQKIALNAISTAVMVRLGKVYDNRMVDVVATNEKLRRRALRLVMQIANCNEARARELLEAAGGRVKIAIVMGRRGLSCDDASKLLADAGGFLRACL